MAVPTDLEFLLRVALATGCGALIGLERQYRSRTAGLRTQALVAAGAAAFVLVGEQAGTTIAPLQITAYVVSGVGFLGGGVILRQGFTVQGLNTAATLWCSAAVGCQAATGHPVPALTITAMVLAIHLFLWPIGRLVDRAPAGGEETVGSYLLTLDVRRSHESHLRAQLPQALAGGQITLRGLSSHGSEPCRGTTSAPTPPTAKHPVTTGLCSPVVPVGAHPARHCDRPEHPSED
ncbi:MgtC/SapB family protein [Nakamurella sp. PAMC28650]|uniref:MgtC/SapB family protein n=1 Tax=Nakamurella sp. PAMC28650 TaxID=2762325 RepID=UPI00164DBA66|nr:MgtC/SapB family protein [Nakamurella sp. PAMC28650]QNK79407.1 MgtC/SapB family protein [Nakamurella sp. PAMC28650]